MKILSPKHFVKTRWLSMGESLKRILEIWDSLSKYMNAKPKFGVTKSKYEEFVNLFESRNFKAQIQVLSAIITKLNQINIKFQDQSLEIQHIKLEIQKFLKFVCSLYIKIGELPDFNQVEKHDWNTWENKVIEKEKFLPYDEFLVNLITDLDSKLETLTSLDLDDQENLTNIFQPFLAEIASQTISYFPLSDELINSFDFVTLNLEPSQIKKVF